MTPYQLLELLQARGISVWRDDENVRLKPGWALSADLLEAVQQLKTGLLDLLPIAPVTRAPHDTERTSAHLATPEVPTEKPAFSAFLGAVASQQHPVRPGLIRMSNKLLTLWQAAETEAGHPLTLSGAPRAKKIKRDPHKFYPRDAYDRVQALNYAWNAPDEDLYGDNKTTVEDCRANLESYTNKGLLK